MNEIYESIERGLNEALEHAKGKKELKTTTVSIEPVRTYRAEEIKKIRKDIGMTQVFFADLMGVSKKTIEAWEAGHNKPNGSACRILTMIERDPELPEKFNFVTLR